MFSFSSTFTIQLAAHLSFNNTLCSCEKAQGSSNVMFDTCRLCSPMLELDAQSQFDGAGAEIALGALMTPTVPAEEMLAAGAAKVG